MTDLLAARTLMAVSLGFHILFGVAGIGMPLFMALAEWRHQRTGDPIWTELARRWARGAAILFAVGAVSGTVLSFELSLLWPAWVELSGAAIGLPFTLEGFAFFLEAIFLGIYLYGGDRIGPRTRLASAAVVAASGLASGVFVTAVNAFMQSPGAAVLGGLSPAEAAASNPMVAFSSPVFISKAVHVALSAYVSVAFVSAGIHAFGLLRTPSSAFHRKALGLALAIAVPLTPLQILSGDRSARVLAEDQPAKLAALEAHFVTGPADMHLGGIPDPATGEVRFALLLPGGLSFLLHGDRDAVVPGVDSVPVDDRPPVVLPYLAFQIMVAAGTILLAISVWIALAWIRSRTLPSSRWLLRALVLAAPLGLIAMEAGWIGSEVARQPWIVRGAQRVEDAVTAQQGLILPLIGFTALYVVLGIVTLRLLRRHVFATLNWLEGAP
jgi:cytochrome bd ubiquinol oxidase subunit I